MFRVVICDDNNEFAEHEKEIILSNFDNGSIEVTDCHSGEELLSSKLKNIDLIILDYEMKGIDGFETSERIANKYPHIPMVFSTVYIELSREGYRHHGFRYLVKTEPSFVTELIECVTSAMEKKKKHDSKTKMIRLSTGDYNINTDDIIYLEAQYHYVEICFIDHGKIEMGRLRGKVDDVVKAINNDSITMIRKGVGINLKYISKVNGVGRIRISALNEAVKEFVVADNYMKEFRQLFLSYYGELRQ